MRREGVGENLDVANVAFRAAYARARDAAARAAPIFAVLGDDLVFCYEGRRAHWSFTPPGFRELKGAAHALVLVSSLLAFAESKIGSAETAPYGDAVERSLAQLRDGAGRDSGATGEGSPVARAVKLVEKFAARRGSGAAVESCPEDAREVLAVLTELTERGAAVRLASLHARVNDALRPLTASVRAGLFVVVAGDHQARARSLGVQYFERRLPVRGDGAKRVIYGESVTSEEEAIALVGTNIVDRVLAQSIFGDPKKLQQDVLGDATEKQLSSMNLDPIA